jgi:hypothetical protein
MGRNLHIGGLFKNSDDGDVSDIRHITQLGLGANMRLTKTVSGTGGEYTFKIEMKNRGPARAYEIIMTDKIPDRYTIFTMGINAPFTCRENGQQIVCTSDVMLSGDKSEVLVTVRADDSVPAKKTNCAFLAIKNYDPTPANKSCVDFPPPP